MYLSEVIGKKLTNVYIKTKHKVKEGLDSAETCLEIDGKTTIRFPRDFEDINLKARKSWWLKSQKELDSFNEIKNSTIVDFIMLEDPISTGFFELDNGKIIYEVTTFPTGAMETGLKVLPSAEAIKKEFEENIIRYTESKNYLNVKY